MSCKYCMEIKEHMDKFSRNEPYVSEFEFAGEGHDSGWDVPVHFCPNCGTKLIWDDRSRSLRELYNDYCRDSQISFYNIRNELILNENNVCDCDAIVEKYGDTYTYSWETDLYNEHVYITLDIE